MRSFQFPYSSHTHGPPGTLVPALECVDVCVRYPRSETTAVRNVSLKIAQGERIALIGENGAGKSTLLKAAAGLLPVASGSLRVHGSAAGGCCHRIAYLAQRGELDWRFPMTVRRLVLTGRYVHLGWFAWPKREDLRIAEKAMEVLQIEDLADKRIGELSGGQQQRTLLARALAQEADTLLLDEPLNAVDAKTRKIVRDVLRSLSDAGKTIIAATHDPHDIEVEFEKIIHLRRGRCEDRPQTHDDNGFKSDRTTKIPMSEAV
jgi:ABC-type Mn2+/Zn2+ transport system ATPase subunit